jgi:putative ABC transport system permease protein
VFGITISDLLYRRRQFLIAIFGAGLVFAMTFLLAGLTNGFAVEIDQTVTGFHADVWVVKAGSAARVASLTPFAESEVAGVAATPGVTTATPVVVIPQTANRSGKLTQVNMIGAPVGSAPSQQPLTSGSQVTGSGQAVVDQRMGASLGTVVGVGGHEFRVVGITSDRTMLGGIPNMYVPLADAQAAVFQGAPIISAVVVTGSPGTLPSGLSTFTNQQIDAGSLDQMATAVSSINNSKLFMWVIAAVIVASLVYVTALERTRDFAVLKALGASSGKLYLGLAFQAVLVALIAALIAVVLAQFMTGIFAQPIDYPASAYVTLPLSAVLVGLLASLIALRRAVGADPAKAFAG